MASTWPVVTVQSPAMTRARSVPEVAPGTTMTVAGRPCQRAWSTRIGGWPPATCETQAGVGGTAPEARLAPDGPGLGPPMAFPPNCAHVALTCAFRWPG